MMCQFLARSVAVLGLTLLVACASGGPAEFDRGMSIYVGQPEVRLIEGLGVPQRVYETEGRRFLEYDLGGAPVPVSSGFSFGLGAGSFGGGPYRHDGGVGTGIGIGIPLGGSSYEAAPCVVTFEVRDARIFDFRHQGGSCR